jgi:hypothetical protein
VQIGLDTYVELDFVSISYVRGLKFTPCKHKNHHHTVPIVEGAGTSTVKTYGVFHLIIDLTHRWERTVSLTRPFVAIDRSIMDTPILFGRQILQNLAITRYRQRSWELGVQEDRASEISFCEGLLY